MQFIDKQNQLNELEGNEIVSSFIKSQWQDDSQKYINLNYKSFDHSALVKILRKEQLNFCCYCMRTLTDKNTTLEHVIPNKTTDQKIFEEYKHVKVLKDNVVLWPDEYFYTIQTFPPFPHFIAYQNLVASCNGELVVKSDKVTNSDTSEAITSHQCCNLRRSNQYIEPLFFIENINELISYSKSGDILFDVEFEKTINTLNLNHDSLVLMRKVWFEIGKEYSIEAVNTALFDSEKRLEILDDINLDVMLKLTLYSDVYWNLLSQYSWFYDYYKNNKLTFRRL